MKGVATGSERTTFLVLLIEVGVDSNSMDMANRLEIRIDVPSPE